MARIDNAIRLAWTFPGQSLFGESDVVNQTVRSANPIRLIRVIRGSSVNLRRLPSAATGFWKSLERAENFLKDSLLTPVPLVETKTND